MDKILEQLLLEEQQLQFTHFNEDTAWQIGCWLVDYAIENKLPITMVPAESCLRTKVMHGLNRVRNMSYVLGCRIQAR